MLEIRNVTKIYKTRGGADTRALDNVSISFGETGMVFLLGKSGSGKSTLLNVSGGLDEPTSGEVIVKGKSSKNFSGSDFDSYRNTFVGFIFQEYNILDEFNVEDNIALALELQGKNKDKEKIRALLRDVDLEMYAKRKPNTLSGGQKQRIAIARALVKDPQIIMADEPTGALDSATGKQVFDTLKKLSETRLVIVVSHDREFAEIYGDRIVELKDGKIISDVTKAKIAPERLDENVSVIGNHTLQIKSGAKLTESNFKTIQEFISSSDGDVIISNGEQEISAFKKASRMSEDGETESFNETDVEAIKLKEYTPAESKFIRSRLPARKALKIGASGLKLKPVRLMFTILLSFIAFTMFGLLSTLMVYDDDTVLAKSFASGDYDYINLEKNYLEKYSYDDGDYWYSQNSVNFTPDEVSDFQQKYAGSFGYYESGNSDVANVKLTKSEYYYPTISKFGYLNDGHALRSSIKVGAYPQADDELCISSYLYDVMKNGSFTKIVVTTDAEGNVDYAMGEELDIKSENDVIGEYLILNNTPFKICGIYDSGAIPSKFDGLANGSNTDYMLTYEFSSYLDASLCFLAFVSEGFYDAQISSGLISGSQSGDKYVEYFENTQEILSFNFPYTEYYESWKYDEETGISTVSYSKENSYTFDYFLASFTSVNSIEKASGLSYIFLDGNKNSLADNEVLLDLTKIYEFESYYRTAIYEKAIDEGNFDNLSEDLDALSEEIYRIQNLVYGYAYGYCDYVDEDGNSKQVYLSDSERLEMLAEIKEAMKEFSPVDITLKINDSWAYDFKVVGFFYAPVGVYPPTSGCILSQNFIDSNLVVYSSYGKYETNYVAEENCIYGGIYVAYDKTESMILDLLDNVGIENVRANDVFYKINNPLYNSVVMVNGYVEVLSTVFLWAGIIFAIFSALLLFNFISVSISNKRKEIGILRAVGARGVDVFKIFFSESGIIVLICTVLAIIGTLVTCGIVNNILLTNLNLAVTLFVFGPISILMMIGIAIVVAFIATFLPVFFAARKKPVESIRAL